MGLTVYLDTCIVIYIVEENSKFLPLIEQISRSTQDLSFTVSPLTELECMVMPLRTNNRDLLDKFGLWFENTPQLTLNRQVFLEASKLRADLQSLKTPDAIHLAAAQYYGVDEFWTNDDRLKSVTGTPVVRNIARPDA
ncbi:MAG: PIN domain-containing protein [Pyrinomonadaceae bacterium]|nr:PIN domain-containing protein [Pyrinomonadaceae bacterium]